jgi:thiamine biosynthesis lipoprotein
MANRSFRLWGVSAEVAVAEAARLGAACDAVDRTVAEMERSCGAYRGDSDLARVNARAGRPVRVGPVFVDVVTAALRAAALADGTADPLRTRLAEPRHAGSPTWRSITVDAGGRVGIPPGTVLDIGRLGLALTADRAGARAHRVAGCGVMVRIGRHIRVSGNPPDGGWLVRAGDEPATGGIGQEIVLLRPGGLATAGGMAGARPGEAIGGRVLDGKSRFEGRWLSVTVAAGTCADACTASVVAIKRGNEAPCWLESSGLPARLVQVDGWVHRAAGWPLDRSERPGVRVAG